MDTFYEGEHSIIFGSKHSWDDWKLIPAKLHNIPAPSINEKTIEIPGASGYLDLTDTLLGFPTYKDRTGNFEFYVANDQLDMTRDQLYSELCAYLHGRRRQCILTDDPAYYYEGRFSVDSFSAGKSYSTVQIKYTLDPYKYLRWTTCGDWLWDPFDFIYGEITQSDFKDLPVVDGSQNFRKWTRNQIGGMPVCPVITTSITSGSTMTLKIDNVGTGKGVKTFTLQNGENLDPQIMLVCPDVDDYVNMTVTGVGTISFDFRPGGI